MHYFCIPYRDSEFSGGKYRRAFEKFKPYFRDYLKHNNYKFSIIYVEQIQDKNLFKTGKLNNVGFDLCKQFFNIKDGDVFAHHPVDQMPIDVDYSVLQECNLIFDARRDYPKVHIFKVEAYKKINGYSNDYEGWGHEDTDMMERLKICNISTANTFYNFEALACNGTGITDGPGNYSPKYDENWKILDELKNSKNIYYSGLNTLSYKSLNFKETDSNEYHCLVDIY